ncbi:anillin-like [Zophobas morio]|uniref:anillin-like n=1 Tax=Zophobas morio TaxID=2755281 RepID=UPI00308362E3
MPRWQIGGSSSSSNCENSHCSTSAKIAENNSDLSINTSDYSASISSAMLGETVENVLRYLDDCINGGTSTEEISSPSFEEYSSETEETSGDESSNLSLELLKTKNWMLQQTKDQLLKAIAYHEKQNRLTLSKERLEAEKLLLITDAKLQSLSCEPKELARVENESWFCSGDIEISNMQVFPKGSKDQHFVCLIIVGSKVFAAEAEKKKWKGCVYFNAKFKLPNLQPNFKLKLQIYSASSKDFKKNSLLSQAFCDYPSYESEVPYRKSVFSLWGEEDIELCHLTKSGNLQIQMGSGLFAAFISSRVNINMKLYGFVNVSKTWKNYLSWDRKFCYFIDGVLNYYNYPPNDLNKDTPTDVINVETCELTIPSREECCRKRTICLKVNGSDSVLMCFETQQEFEYWAKYLNIAVSQIKMWNKI